MHENDLITQFWIDEFTMNPQSCVWENKDIIVNDELNDLILFEWFLGLGGISLRDIQRLFRMKHTVLVGTSVLMHWFYALCGITFRDVRNLYDSIR